MMIDGRRIGYLLERVNRAAMKALERHAPCEPMTAAIVMEAYEEFLAGDFKEQMADKYNIEYPLNMNVIDKKT